MLDINLRPLKDVLFDPLCHYIPSFISPLHLTLLAFICGIQAYCLDGALARSRKQASDLGGFLDLLGDFIVYSMIPICCALGQSDIFTFPTHEYSSIQEWLAVALLEASFHINNFVLFYVAAILEKTKASKAGGQIRELTSVMMKPALIEGFESGLFFTAMLAYPQYTEALSWIMAGLVSIGIMQRVLWLLPVLN
ncbi:CDP-alcohol phosphatidyltransferase [Glonium stellatum]|uniref:CDP-alcohol phosphatidyltransferase n=1 Tax=Glonium stellatum TaxID=574774 RepID=A0A8E2JXL9_9PEZI|nr:CDP-alcohol phosphatidyltransferase [Glonium stellatum]